MAEAEETEYVDVPPTPPGVMTSEFWLTVLGVAAMVVLTLLDKVSGEVTTAAISAACLGYAGTRAAVKRSIVSGEAVLGNFRADLASLSAAEAEKPPSRAKRTTAAR